MALEVPAVARGSRIARTTLAVALGLAIVSTATPVGAADGQPNIAARAPTYALIAAVGGEIAVVTEHPTTGTHLSPFRRTSVDVENDLLNRLVLHSLDAAIAKLDPDSRRVYMTLKPGGLEDVAAPRREGAALGRIVTALETMPQRSEWDRIVVVTPTYAASDRDGLPGKLQGPGYFVEPMCQGRTGKTRTDYDSCSTNARPPAGPEATAPDDTVSPVNYYAAPFSYVQVWILDPRTLAVIDQQKVFDSQKLFDPGKPMGMPSAEFMTDRFAVVVQKSIRKAIDDTVLRGKVETEIREVGPDDGRH